MTSLTQLTTLMVLLATLTNSIVLKGPSDTVVKKNNIAVFKCLIDGPCENIEWHHIKNTTSRVLRATTNNYENLLCQSTLAINATRTGYMGHYKCSDKRFITLDSYAFLMGVKLETMIDNNSRNVYVCCNYDIPSQYFRYSRNILRIIKDTYFIERVINIFTGNECFEHDRINDLDNITCQVVLYSGLSDGYIVQ